MPNINKSLSTKMGQSQKRANQGSSRLYSPLFGIIRLFVGRLFRGAGFVVRVRFVTSAATVWLVRFGGRIFGQKAVQMGSPSGFARFRPVFLWKGRFGGGTRGLPNAPKYDEIGWIHG